MTWPLFLVMSGFRFLLTPWETLLWSDIAPDRDHKCGRPSESVNGIIGKPCDESLLDTQFQHLPG